jgi:DNA-binding winged helix-turn-helix (wHTH) protein
VPRSAYQFADFTVSPARRQLLRGGRELPLIPRYFDLLLLLLERRHEVVHRRDLLDEVWNDVVVSDNALNQAVRALRRILGDDARSARFIRTASRHGYQFVHPEVCEVEESAVSAPNPTTPSADTPEATSARAFDEALAELLAVGAGAASDAQRRDAARTLLSLDAPRALREVEARGDAKLRAVLRDARWDVPDAGSVPFFGRRDMWRSALALVALRSSDLWVLARRRWIAAVLGGAGAGLFAGAVGATALWLGPGAAGSFRLLVVIPILGLVLGALGAAGVGIGLCLAEVAFRAARGPAVVAGGALGGAAIGGLTHGFAAVLLQGLFGHALSATAGGFEGLAIGGATGLGYALATPRRRGGLAAPTGMRRVWAALLAGAICAAVTAGLGAQGSYLGAMSLDVIAGAFPGSEVRLDPVARLLGEASPGVRTRVVVSAWEGLVFATGVVFGLTHRPRRTPASDALEALE